MASSDDDYREQAQFCMKMAAVSRSEIMKAEWLSLAGKWLALIPAADTAFDDLVRAKGTGQGGSSSSN
jgi:hypothetical protein